MSINYESPFSGTGEELMGIRDEGMVYILTASVANGPRILVSKFFRL
jgi:hypothetical protein